MNSNTSPNDVNCPSMMSVRARRALFESSRTTPSAIEAIASADTQEKSRGTTISRASIGQSTGTTGNRQPLGFLSPNYKPRRFSLKGNENKESKLKTKISDLQQRIQGFETSVNNIDVRDDISSDCGVGSASSIQRSQRDEQLVELNKRLLHIQTGLVEIEGERCQLVSKVKQLEREKESLSKQLTNREKEIETIQKRFVLAGEQSKESSALRSSNNMLSKEILHLKAELNGRDVEQASITDLKLQLQESQTIRDELKERLKDVQRDHSCVCDELAKCLVTVDQLMSEKREWENEKGRLQQEYDMQLEQQRLDHIQATIDLRQELRVREVKVQDLDRLLKDKVGSIQQLRTQLSQVEAAQADTLKQVTVEYDRKIQGFQNDLRHKVAAEVEQEMHNEMSALQAKLLEKSSEIEALRADVGMHMQELMIATCELQKMQEDSAMLESLFRDVEALEHERFELSETLHEKDTEIAELSAEILKLEIEKELSAQDSLKLHELKVAYDLAKKECESSDSRLNQVMQACNDLESEILRINTENDEAVARIRADCDTTICDIQLKLQHAEEMLHTSNERHTVLIVAKDEVIAKLGDQIDSIMLNYQRELASLRDDLNKSALTWTAKEDELRSICNRDLSEKDSLLSMLREEMERVTEMANAKETELHKKLDCANERVKDLMSKCAYLEEHMAQQASHHEGEISKLIKCKADLLKEKEELQCTIIEQTCRLDDFKVSGRKSVIRADTKISQLEEQIRQLKATTFDLENCSAVCSREHAQEVECMRRTISELESSNESSKLSIERYEELLQETREQLNKQQLAFDSELARLELQLKQRKVTAIDHENNATTLRMKHIVSSLQNEIKLLREKNLQLQERSEKVAEISSNEYQVTLEKLTVAIDDLRRERDFSNISLLSCQRKLEEEKTERALLVQKYDVLRQSEISLRDECQSFSSRMEEAQAERNKLELSLEQEMNRNHTASDSLQDQLASAEKTLVNYEEQMSKLEEALQERTKMISDMLSSTKELQIKVDRSELEYKTLEERSSLLQVRLLDKDDELKRFRNEWQHREDEYLGELHRERNAREILEADLATTTARLEAAKVESRDLSELEKENLALKDKIRRQEAYLQRKIEQDKAVRERILPGSHAKALTMKTPARCNRVRKSISSSSTPSTVPDTESTNIDVDLDSLLAD